MKASKEKSGGPFNFKSLLKNKYALIVLAAGLVLILLPNGSGGDKKSEETEISAPSFSLQQEELRLQKQLCKIKGAGRVSVLLSVEGSASRQLAENGEEALVISGSGGEKVVDLYYVNPKYIGAVIVCDGAASAQVRLSVTRAACAFTGLSTERVMVIQMS